MKPSCADEHAEQAALCRWWLYHKSPHINYEQFRWSYPKIPN